MCSFALTAPLSALPSSRMIIFTCAVHLWKCNKLHVSGRLSLSSPSLMPHMRRMLTRPVGLSPWGASAACLARLLKTQQIKVTAGMAKPARDSMSCSMCGNTFLPTPRTSKNWPDSREFSSNGSCRTQKKTDPRCSIMQDK